MPLPTHFQSSARNNLPRRVDSLKLPTKAPFFAEVEDELRIQTEVTKYVLFNSPYRSLRRYHHAW